MSAPPDAVLDLVKALLVPGGVVATVAAVILGWKKGPGTKPVEATVVSATIADSAAVRALVEALQHNTSVLLANRAESIVSQAEEQASRMKLIGSMDELAATIRRNGVPPDWLAALGHLKD